MALQFIFCANSAVYMLFGKYKKQLKKQQFTLVNYDTFSECFETSALIAHSARLFLKKLPTISGSG
jgi:hypothetical protein